MTTPPNWHCKFCGEPIGGRGTYCSERCARGCENDTCEERDDLTTEPSPVDERPIGESS